MNHIQRIQQGLVTLGLDQKSATDRDVSLCSEGAMIGAAKVHDALGLHVESVKARHEDCPTDCYMPGIQFTMELLLVAQVIERYYASRCEARWQDETLPHDERIRAAGEWTSWLVLEGVFTEPRPQILAAGGRVSTLLHMVLGVADKWPLMVNDVFGTLLQIEVPDDATGVEG